MHQECLALLRQMVAIPSASGGEKQLAEFIAGFLEEELGMRTELQPLAEGSCNVIGRWSGAGRGKGRLLLGGHIDTVSPAEGWQTDPYRLTPDGDKLRGLGAADMKGGLAAQLTVLKRLREEGPALDAEVEFLGLADEERYSAGANAYVERAGREESPESFFIMGEPHYNELVVGATGKVLLALTTTGKGAQAAAPEKGINAIDNMAVLLTAINEVYGPKYRRGERASHCCLRMESTYHGYSLTVPDECRCWINKQLKPDEPVQEFIAELHRQYDARVGQGSLQIRRELPSYPAYRLPPDEKHVTALRTYLKDVCRREPAARVNQSVSDGNIFYTALQIPTVLYGPFGEHFHTENEYVSQRGLAAYMTELYGFLAKTYGR